MKQLFLRRWWIAFISCGISAGIVYACADGWGEEYGVSNFAPEVFVDSAYSPFFYSENYYYRIGYDDDQHTRFNDENATDWSVYLNQKLTLSQLHYFLEDASLNSIDSATASYNGNAKSLPATMQSFEVFKTKRNKKVTGFLRYLSLAKKCEPFALNEIRDYWNYDSIRTRVKKTDDTGMNNQLSDEIDRSTDLFMKERYWFQLVRLSYFTGAPQDAISAYNKYEEQMPRNTLFYRTLSYTAGAYYKMKDYSRSNYYFSRVYDECNALKPSAHFSFHPQEEADWNATLALCKNVNEKATLWQMLGVYYGSPEEAIARIYALNPKSDKLGLLLSRVVNIYEQRFGYPADYSNSGARDSADARAKQLITRIANAANTDKPWVWYMAAGYLNTLDSAYTEATSYYARAEQKIPPNKLDKAQLKLLKVLNKIGGAGRIDSKLEDEILSDLTWLDGIEKNNLYPNLRYTDALAWLAQVIASKYRAQHELVKGECFYNRNEFYADRTNVLNMERFLNNPSKTPFEKLCARLSTIRIGDIYEFQAIQLAYKDSTDDAMKLLVKNDSAANVILPANPFNGRISDCHDCDQAATQRTKYTRLTFLKKVKELKDNIGAERDVYNNALLLGNAYYNISHYGNDRAFYECNILGQYQYSPFIIDSVYRPMLTSMALPARYYRIALSAAKDDEQKAKCHFMLAKCERNAWYNENYYNDAKNEYGIEVAIPLSVLTQFADLKKYSNTRFYQEAIKECGYFEQYTALYGGQS